MSTTNSAGVNLQKLTAPFPDEAIRTRQGGGGRNFDYIPGHIVIHRLNDATNNSWSFRIKETSETVLKDGKLLVKCIVELEIPGCGTRAGLGVQIVSPSGGEDLYKGAVTDGLKKAATLFGVALELYGPDIEGEIQAEQEAIPPTRLSEDDTKMIVARFTKTARSCGYVLASRFDAEKLYENMAGTKFPTVGDSYPESLGTLEGVLSVLGEARPPHHERRAISLGLTWKKPEQAV